jgi:two-component sensor histidine kinase
VLSVEDDGVGYDVKANSGLGGRIVRAMTTKLGGEVKQEARSLGARIEVVFEAGAPKKSGG